MKIVTIFNYPDEQHFNIMCCTWIRQVKRYCHDSEIMILSSNNLPSTITTFMEKYTGIEVVIGDHNSTISFEGHPDCVKATHNVLFKLWNLCKIYEPFIFIDADAFILKDYDDLLSASKDKPLIGVNHQNIPGETDMLPEPVMNSGVMLVSDPRILDWDDIISILMRDRGFRYPGTDQSLLNSYLKESNYDYTHESVGFEWNSWAKYTVFDEQMNARCVGLDREHDVFINHYWNFAKPWNLDCPIYNEVKNENLISEPSG